MTILLNQVSFLLLQHTKISERPVAKPCLSDNCFLVDIGICPFAGIPGISTVVSHHEIRILRNRIRTIVFILQIGEPVVVIDIVFLELVAVNECNSVFDLNRLPRKTDDTLYKKLFRIVRITEDDDVPSNRALRCTSVPLAFL